MIQTNKNERISLTFLEKFDKSVKMQSLTYDVMLKNLFVRNEYIFKRFLISILHLDFYPEECKIHYLDKEFPVINYKEYKKRLDFNISINDCIFVNIELNRSSFNRVKYRNYLYHSKQVSYSLKSGQDIRDLPEYIYIQLNLNAYDKSNNIGEDIIVPYSVKTESIYIENDVIYLKYLDYYYKLYYNENIKKSESDYWLAMLMSKNFTELNDILSRFLPDSLREKIVKDVYQLSMDEFVLEDVEREALDAIELRDTIKYSKIEAREEGLKEGLKEGIEQGIEQKNLEIIKNLLKRNMSYEDISDITGKSIDEIEKIEEML